MVGFGAFSLILFNKTKVVTCESPHFCSLLPHFRPTKVSLYFEFSAEGFDALPWIGPVPVARSAQVGELISDAQELFKDLASGKKRSGKVVFGSILKVNKNKPT